MKTCLIIQPGAVGDIFLVSPIAKHYHDLGYKILWPVRAQFIGMFSYTDYVQPILLGEDIRDSDWLRSDVIKVLELDCYKNADLVLNLADRGPGPTQQRNGENWETAKYRIAGVDFSKKHTLSWRGHSIIENALKQEVLPKGGDYIFAHNTSSHGEDVELPAEATWGCDVVLARPIPPFSIFDWYGVIKGSKAIYCTESSFFNFIEGFADTLDQPLFLLKRNSLRPGFRYCHAKHWNKKLIGETVVSG